MAMVLKHPDSVDRKKVPGIKVIIFIFAVILLGSFMLRQSIKDKIDSIFKRSNTAEAVQNSVTQPVNSDDIYESNDETNNDLEIDLEESEPEEIYAMSHKEEIPDALSDEPVKLSDIYAEKDSIVIFRCFYPDAVRYIWEIYDINTKNWVEASPDDIVDGLDELYRNTSSLWITADPENNEIMIRCTIDFETKESIVDTATLYVLDKQIKNISAEDFTTDSGQYISSKYIPVNITYLDGSQETLTGLNGLHFLNVEETKEHSTTISGNSVDTITTIITSCDYSFVDMQQSDIMLRYQCEDTAIDIPIKLIGVDLSAPKITSNSSLSISDFEISNIDRAVPVTVAEDNDTPYPDLEYAFLPEGEDVKEDDWIRKSTFDVEITKNGIWIAYCRDQSGNIATEEREIITVDNKAPTITLGLEYEGWCQKNKILVNATDRLSIEYCYSCAETGEDSGWITRNEYEVLKNGLWNVRVRDAAGNVTEQDIEISNIDNQMPVIKGITEIDVKGVIINNE